MTTYQRITHSPAMGDQCALLPPPQLEPKRLTQLVWSLGKIEYPHQALLDEILRRVLQLEVEALDSVGVTTLVWALGKLRYQDEAEFEAVAHPTPGFWACTPNSSCVMFLCPGAKTPLWWAGGGGGS